MELENREQALRLKIKKLISCELTDIFNSTPGSYEVMKNINDRFVNNVLEGLQEHYWDI